MRFFTRSKVSILFSLVTIIVLAGAFTLTALFHGQAIHAATSSASSSTPVKGTATAAGPFNLKNAPAQPTESGQPVHLSFKVNRMGINGAVHSRASVMPSATATAVSSPATSHTKKNSKGSSGKLLQSFDGASDKDNAAANSFILAPPDQGLCVGPLATFGQEVVIEPVNLVYNIYTTNGTPLLPHAISLSYLFQETPFNPSTGTGTFLSDPRCQYDTQTQDFFFTVLAINFTNSTSHLDVTVLHQDATFFVYRFDTTDASYPHCPCFGDQPLLGLDAYNIYVSSNEFPIATSPYYNGAEVYAISKSQLASGTGGTANYVEFAHLSDQGILIETLQPAITLDPRAPAEYLLHAFVVDANGNNTSYDHRLGIFAITNQAAVTAGGTPTLSNPTVINSEAYAQPNPAPEPNGNVLNSDDDRMQQVEYINGNLLGALSTGILIKGDSTPRDGVAWWDIEPALQVSLTVKARIKHQGYIAASGLYILYPAIMQSKDSTVEMAFSITNSTTNPSAAYTVVPDGPHGKNAGAVVVAATGSGSYSDTFTCNGPAAPGCRWGDYSWATLDPFSSNIWMASEYVPPPSRQISNANWGTRTYEVSA